jgi:non-ribosomal peptide synthase protein (TIGR01720 family)
VQLKAPRKKYLSNVTGTWIKEEEARDRNYWVRHLRETVRFGENVKELLGNGGRVLLEVGPGNVLGGLARRQGAREVYGSLQSAQEAGSEGERMARSLGRLWVAGVKVDWEDYYRAEKRHRVALPTYPFERQRYWIEAQPSSEPREQKLHKKADVADWFYVASWERSNSTQLPNGQKPAAASASWLVFIDECGTGQEVARRLRQDGNEVTTVAIADNFAKLRDGSYDLDPMNRDSYATLLRELHSSGKIPQKILHLWNLSERGSSTWQHGLYSLLYLAQAFASEAHGGSPSITVVTSNAVEVTGDEELYPLHATALGFSKAIQQELKYPCRVLDVHLPAEPDIQRSADRIISELLIESREPVVAYRGNYRWIQRFRPMPQHSSDAQPLRNGGVYLIVGGLGQIGLDLARHVAERARANLVLVSLTGLPVPRERWETILSGPDNALRHKIEKIKALEQAGSRVSIMSSDASDARRMKEVVAEVERQFGRLDGVFYAAGSKISNTLQAFSREECHQQLRTKIEGLQVLEQVLYGKQLDFVVIISSLASILGAIGFPAYAAAHAYADCFVHKHNRSSSVRWTGINLDNWIGTNDTALPKLRDGVILGMSFDEGSEVIGRVLSSPESTQWLISTTNLDARIETWLSPSQPAETPGPESSSPAHPRPSLPNEYVAPENPVQEKLTEIWQQLLGIEKVGIQDNFFELGGDSVISLQVVSRCRQAGLELTPKQIFERQTIAELAPLVVTSTRRADQSAITGSVLLTPIQRWFIEQDFPDADYFNQAVLLEFQNAWPVTFVAQALQCLVEHHDSLRLRYQGTERGWESRIAPHEKLSFRCEEISRIPESERSSHVESVANETHASLNLSEGPLFRAVLFDSGRGIPSRLLLVAHHLAVDLISWRILIEDLQTACEQISRGQAIQLPAKTDSFKHWAEQLNADAASSSFDHELSYWAADERKQVAALPVDHVSGRREATEVTAGIVCAELGSNETRALLYEIPVYYGVHTHEALLAAMAQSFVRWSGVPKLLVDLEGLGREGLKNDVDLSRTVGWFTTVYPVLLEVPNGGQPDETLRMIKSQLRLVPNRGIGYGVLRYLSQEQVVQQLRDLPQAEICFLYQGHVGQRSAGTPLFRQIHEPIGAEHSQRTPLKYLFSLNSWIAAGRLHVDWIFSEQLYHRKTVERLKQDFLAGLRSLITGCNSPRPRDQQKEIPEFNWEQSDVLNIAAAIGKAPSKS